MQRRRALVMLASSAIGGSDLLRARSREDQKPQTTQDHVAWVSEVLEQMLTIKPGMTRIELLTLFTTEGGISWRLWRTYASRRCPLFKVDVVLKAVGEPDTEDEGDDDIILKISRPYLQFTIAD
jgi:hypothetical protein